MSTTVDLALHGHAPARDVDAVARADGKASGHLAHVRGCAIRPPMNAAFLFVALGDVCMSV
jgi:hypothetical protein